MEKVTVLAKVRAEIKFSPETLGWLKEIPKIDDENVWLKKQNGIPFFSEFGGLWERDLIETGTPIIQNYFRDIGIPKADLPLLKVYESFPGSWIIDAAVIIVGSMGVAHKTLKSASELPEIAKGLSELKNSLLAAFRNKVTLSAYEKLRDSSSRYNCPPPPKNTLIVNYTIDARPLGNLSPAIMKSHKIHLSVAISRDSFSLENLGEDTIDDIRIGLFKSKNPRNRWSFGDSFVGRVDILSSNQTISKNLNEFRNSSGKYLDLPEDQPVYVDCWIQDSHGIYLFMFYLDDW